MTKNFWRKILEEATLTVVGNQPTTTEIDLMNTAGDWNLIGYPSTLSPDLPGALSEIDGEYTLVYAYQAPDSGDPWKVFDADAPEWSNDLEAMAPGWGYWIFVTADTSLSVNFE